MSRAITTDADLAAIHQAGRGFVYNDFAGGGQSGAAYNVLHVAACRYAAPPTANTSVPKLFFDTLEEAASWLNRLRGPEGRNWKRCGTCLSGPAPRPSGPTRSSPSSGTRQAGRRGVVRSTPGTPVVEAWSSQRLPFEPDGAMLRFRNELRQSLSRLAGRPGQTLAALYTSPVRDPCDVENVLIYNVGTGAFTGAARHGLRFERGFARGPAAPGLEDAPHYYRYELVQEDEPSFAVWARGRTIASIRTSGPGALGGDSAKVASIWHAAKRGEITVPRGNAPPGDWGMTVTVRSPHSVHPAPLVKALFDGLVASLHVHDGTDLEEISARIAQQLYVEPDEIEALLLEESKAALGSRRLAWLRGEGVQWNPGDDQCVAGSLHIERVRSGSGWELEAEVWAATAS